MADTYTPAGGNQSAVIIKQQGDADVIQKIFEVKIAGKDQLGNPTEGVDRKAFDRMCLSDTRGRANFKQQSLDVQRQISNFIYFLANEMAEYEDDYDPMFLAKNTDALGERDRQITLGDNMKGLGLVKYSMIESRHEQKDLLEQNKGGIGDLYKKITG